MSYNEADSRAKLIDPELCEPALKIDQQYRVSRQPHQHFATPVGVQSGRRFAVPDTKWVGGEVTISFFLELKSQR